MSDAGSLGAPRGKVSRGNIDGDCAGGALGGQKGFGVDILKQCLDIVDGGFLRGLQVDVVDPLASDLLDLGLARLVGTSLQLLGAGSRVARATDKDLVRHDGRDTARRRYCMLDVARWDTLIVVEGRVVLLPLFVLSIEG